MRKWYQLLVLPAVLFTAVSFGAPESDSGEELSTVPEAGATVGSVAVPGTSEAKILGTVELRPTMYLSGSNPRVGNDKTKAGYGMESTVEAGYRFNKNFALIAHQEINNNFENVGGTFGNGPGSATVYAVDGLVRAPWDNIWSDADAGLSFGWEPRVYAPTNQLVRQYGFQTAIRNYLKLKKTLLNDTMSISLMEIPVLYSYSRDGAVGSTGTQANPIFENRVYLIADWSLFDNKVAISLPFFYHTTFMRNFSPALTGYYRSGATSHYLYAWPEVTYALTPNVNVGAAFQTGSFLPNNDFTSFSASNAFDNGMVQLIVRASL